jgi:hypothetical protein
VSVALSVGVSAKTLAVSSQSALSRRLAARIVISHRIASSTPLVSHATSSGHFSTKMNPIDPVLLALDTPEPTQSNGPAYATRRRRKREQSVVQPQLAPRVSDSDIVAVKASQTVAPTPEPSQ